jgi:hypothetical protein
MIGELSMAVGAVAVGDWAVATAGGDVSFQALPSVSEGGDSLYA